MIKSISAYQGDDLIKLFLLEEKKEAVSDYDIYKSPRPDRNNPGFVLKIFQISLRLIY